MLVGSGFAIGAIIYSVFSRYLEQNGAAVRYPTRVREFNVELLEIDRKDFERLVAEDQVLARAVEQLSHDRALNNLSAGTPGAASWAAIASRSLQGVTQRGQ